MRQHGSDPHFTPPPAGVQVSGRSPTPGAGEDLPLSPIAGETPTLQHDHDPSTPTTRRGVPKKVDVLGQQSDGTKLAADLPAAMPIPSEAQHWVSVLGDSIVRNLHSPDWKTREFGLQAINRSLSNSKWLSERQAINVWRVVTELLDGCLQDKVAPIYHASLELFNSLVGTYSLQLKREVLAEGMDPLIPTLLHRSGNNNARIQECTIQALLTLASTQSLGLSYLAPHALSAIPTKKSSSSTGSSAATQMAGRLELLTSMLSVEAQQTIGQTFGGRMPASRSGSISTAAAAARLHSSSMPTDTVLHFARPALEMPDDKVRQAAVRLIAELYRRHKLATGSDAISSANAAFEVDKGLGPGLKPAMMAVLHRRFEEVDMEIKHGVGPSGPSRPGVAGSAPAGSGTLDDTPVGTTIKVSGGLGGMHLPPINGARNGGLPPIGRGLPPFGATNSSLESSGGFGKPPRTPGTPNSQGRRSTTPPRSSRNETSPGRRMAPGTPPRSGGTSPGRSLAGTTGGMLPGSLQDDELSSMVLIASGGATSPPRTTPNGAAYNRNTSLRARGGNGVTASGERILDDAEEQLIEYILCTEAKEGRL